MLSRSRRALLALALLAAGMLPGSAGAATPIRGLEGVPHFRHVVVLILENENFDDIWGPSSPANYLKSLVPKGVFADRYFATGHASLTNYIALVSGQPANPTTGSDCMAVNLWTCAQHQQAMSNGRNLADQLEDHHLSWKGYMDSMPEPCFHADYSQTAGPDPYQGNSQEPPAGDYADRHNPFVYFDDIVANDARCKAHVVPYTALRGDIRGNRVPAFSFVTPDTCHDGHDDPCSNGKPGGLVSADLWLSQQVPKLLRYLWHNQGLLIVTLDENGFTDEPPVGCCTGGPGGGPGFGGRIGLLALSPLLPAGKVVHSEYDHMSLLRTIEDSFGIDEHLNNAGPASPMADVFRLATAGRSTGP